jgi:hypothetical protein
VHRRRADTARLRAAENVPRLGSGVPATWSME